MPPKRSRRTSPQPSGLVAGDRLKRTKLTRGSSYAAWGWVASEVFDAADITLAHCLATCGFSKQSSHALCANKYSQTDKYNGAPAEGATSLEKRATGESQDDVIVISDDDAPLCSSKACKSNPYCLNYVGQDKWEAEDKARQLFLKSQTLGENPVVLSRKRGHPVGLRNLGATCYANAYLQVWFHVLPFRNGVYRCQLPNDEDFKPEESPIFQLQVTFTAMQQGVQSCFNPVKLVESLKLRTSEQQDAQEFSKLFMAHLDTEFGKQSDPELKTLIADQFQGKQVYVTICEHCQHRSERVSDFLELELSIKNNATLEECITISLQSESLTGNNQYSCPQCDSLRDAKRYTELRELPPVLHFSLLRFVYDIDSMERKKSKHIISYPSVIDMDQFIGSSDSRQRSRKRSVDGRRNLYRLHGILLHKGSSAYHGHYEAQVFDAENQTWFQFNDDVVTKIDLMASKGGPSTKASAKVEQASKRKNSQGTRDHRADPKQRWRVDDSDSDVEIIEPSRLPTTGDIANSEYPHYVSSKEAYMLVYSRVQEDEHSFQSGQMQQIISTRPVPPLPKAMQVVAGLNTEHEVACNAFITKEQEANIRFDAIRKRLVNIYSSWNLSTCDEESVVVSRQALEAWLSRHLVKHTDTAPAEEDLASTLKQNDQTTSAGTFCLRDIVCSHGKLDPARASDMKLITRVAFEQIDLEDGCTFVPTLSPSDVCEICVRMGFEEHLYRIEHPRVVARFDDICSIANDEAGFWISKHWLKDWRLTKPKMHSPARRDPSPDAPEFDGHVMCEHGKLTVNSTNRRRISVEAAKLLQELFPSWMAVPTDSEVCHVCEVLIHISKEDKREVRRQAEEEKAKLKHMHDNALNGNTALLQNVPCAIVPAQFIRAWRQWLFRPGEVHRPSDVDNTQFLCEHGLLCIDPNEETDMNSTVAIIKRSDWDVIEDIYSAGPLIAVENTGIEVKHSISICRPCRLKRKSDFEIAEVTIHILGTDELVPTVSRHSDIGTEHTLSKGTVATYGSSKARGFRQSNRIRQGRGKRRRVTITKAMIVRDLKIMLQEELGIPVISQRLFYRGVELEDSSSTLVSLGVLSNDVIHLREETENHLANSDSDDVQPPRKRPKEGLGFGGTLLSSRTSSDLATAEVQPSQTALAVPKSKACSACTFENDFGASACAVCDTWLL